MNSIALFTLSSSLHDKNIVDAVSLDFIHSIESCLGYNLSIKGDDFSDYGHNDLDLIFIRTGGSEGLFKQIFPSLRGNILLLTSGKSNSLAASLEILSFLNQNGRKGEILHGSAEYIAHRIELLAKTSKARNHLLGQNVGIMGKPSDWLIASRVDKDAVRRSLGVNLIDIPISELIEAVDKESGPIATEPAGSIIASLRGNAPESVRQYVEGAVRIYAGLRKIIAKYDLSGLSVRCFDLLDALKNTACLALALLNAEGIPAGCEGDIPALLSMLIGNALTGTSGFQSNPSQIDPTTGKMLLAHCTIPFNMVKNYSYNTHFESSIGVAIHGEMPLGDATIFKVSGNLDRMFCEEVRILDNPYQKNLCRTQALIQTADPSVCSDYFLKNPIGNHHIIFCGKQKELFEAFMSDITGS